MMKNLWSFCSISLLIFVLIENPRAEISFVSDSHNKMISYLRDALVWFSFGLVLVKGLKDEKMDSLYRDIVEICFIFCAISSLSFVFSPYSSIYGYVHGTYTYIRAIVLMFVCYELAKEASFTPRALNWSVYSVCIYAIMNVVVFLSIKQIIVRDQGFRFSIGNASIHSGLLLLTMLYVYFCSTFKPLVKYSTMLMLFVSGYLTFTTTWIISLFAVSGVASLLFVREQLAEKSLVKLARQKALGVASFSLLIVALLLFEESMAQGLPVHLYSKYIQLVGLFAGESVNSIGTLSIREGQFNMALQMINSVSSPFGLGLEAHLETVPLIENQYYMLYSSLGPVGFVVCACLALSLVFRIKFDKMTSGDKAMFTSVLVVLLYSYTLETAVCFQLLGIFGFALGAAAGTKTNDEVGDRNRSLFGRFEFRREIA